VIFAASQTPQVSMHVFSTQKIGDVELKGKT
jgi:hypothetical protein